MTMDSKPKIGLITYHAAYNFGSVLQAYATQKSLDNLGYKVEVIDYRTPSQTLWYTKDITISKGVRSLIEAPAFLHVKAKRKVRAKKFNDFINGKLHLSPARYTKYEDFKNVNYEIMVSGSDQIWNYGCGEFRFEPFDAIRPYMLDFGSPIKRIAYASSFGPCSPLSIKKYMPYIGKYDHISTREPIGKRYLEEQIDKPVKLVCDPTWLLDKDEWIKLAKDIDSPKKKYILVYTLSWTRRSAGPWLKAIKELADCNGLDVYCISPLHPLKYKGITMLDDAGPLDFLTYLKDATLVITNTFHGTIFSMNFEIPFFSCQAQPGSRQGQMLEICRLEDRIVNSPSEFMETNFTDISFDFSRSTIQQLRKSSIEYLKSSLG